ncbi:MAG: DUF1549 domain-containing protein [Verrucomicrobiae bacterium]|nr:DUF1549 domain-containing protein [Verrucomicrobiae bacterium]
MKTRLFTSLLLTGLAASSIALAADKAAPTPAPAGKLLAKVEPQKPKTAKKAAPKAQPAPAKKEVAKPAPATVAAKQPEKPAKPRPQVGTPDQIDAILAKAWKEAGLKPNAPASDEVFLRRVYLDVIGRVPTLEEATHFLNSDDPKRRARLIDELLASEGYVNHFYHLWADILRINTNAPAQQNITPFYIDWVREALRSNLPYDKFAHELITARGQAWENGAVGYYIRDRGMPLDHMANTVRIFLGTRLECAQCHDHPFDTWTQMDFFHMAAFTYGVNPNGSNYGAVSGAQQMVKKAADMADTEKKDLSAAMTEITRVVRNNYLVSDGKALPKLPHDYKYDNAKPNEIVQPRTMFGEDPAILKPEERVKVYANWLTSEENPLFTTVIANRLWKTMMGAGLYEPVDEFSENSEPSHPELMDFLQQQMIACEYDMKAYLRLILNSQVYQREATAHDLAAGEPYTFVGPVLRRMSAEQIWDSMVALVNPTPEMDDWKRDQQFQLRMAEQEAMQKVLVASDEKDLVEAARLVAQKQKELQKEEETLRDQIAAAEKAGDKAKTAELRREVNLMRTKLREVVMDAVYHPAMSKTKVEEVAMSLPNGEAIEISPMMMDGDGNSSAELRKLQAEAEKAMIEEEMKSMGMEDPKLKSQYASFRKSSMSTMLRAAHISSPAPLGHFLREFGQSDRDTIENANQDASVPQALSLLNGSTFNQVVHPQSVLSRHLAEAKTPEEKLDAIFLSILTRKPSDKEKQLVLAHAKDRGNNLYTDTTFALLNGQEFWFVQ